MTLTKLNGKPDSFKDFENQLKEQELLIEPAEVFDIILDDKHRNYVNELSIGLIKFKRLFSDKTRNITDLFFAAPLNPYIKNYPLKHEIVLIISSPTPESSIIDQETGFYYSDIVGVWRNINHNALPYSAYPIKEKKGNDKEYTSFSGNVKNSNEIKLGDYFFEAIKRPDLIPFEGDSIFQGRFGSSIRFSSTNIKSDSPWSLRGKTGDPLIIIRTDKKNSESYYTIEDINSDGSSIYVCDGQIIPLKPSYFKLNSFDNTPLPPSNYQRKQILINSGRLFLNASEEGIFLNSKKYISISSEGTINFDFGKKFVVGDIKKVQKNVKGEDLIKLLNSLVIPSPMGPLPLNSSPQWQQTKNGQSLLSDKTLLE